MQKYINKNKTFTACFTVILLKIKLYYMYMYMYKSNMVPVVYIDILLTFQVIYLTKNILNQLSFFFFIFHAVPISYI